MDPLQLAVYIWMFFNDLQRYEYREVPQMLWDLADVSTNGDVLGTLLFTNMNITGFETLVSEINNIEVTEDDNGDNNVCVYVPVGYLQLTTAYLADIGIADEIPIYGDGRFQFTGLDVDFRLCTFLSFDKGYVDNLKAELHYRHNPITFTGFWRNEEATALIVRYLDIFNWIFAMWTAYEPERASCVLSPFIEYVLNVNMGYEDNTLKFNTTCIQGILSDLEVKSGSFEKYLNFPANMSIDEDALKAFIQENKYEISYWIRNILYYVRKVLI